MNEARAHFDRHGFVVSDPLLSDPDLNSIASELPNIETSGTRTLLERAVFRQLADRLRSHERLCDYLRNLVAVEGIFFRKSLDRNWSLQPHRDTVVPVLGDGPWKSAGKKEGMFFAHAPLGFMDRCVALRLALDEVPEGDIRVEPSTYTPQNNLGPKTLVVPRGGAILMRPGLVHSSTKLHASAQRRVVHFLYAPRDIPDTYRWYHAA